MAVLLQYNKNDTLSLDELDAATGIGKEMLKQVLATLVKPKVLINEETDQYDLNPSMCMHKLDLIVAAASHFDSRLPLEEDSYQLECSH